MTRESGNDKIYRRDFINGMLIAAGTAAVGGSFPMRAYGAGTTLPCDGPIGSDPNVLRGGNVPSAFNIAHWLRDDRLTFKTTSVVIASSPCNSFQGSEPIRRTAAGGRGGRSEKDSRAGRQTLRRARPRSLLLRTD